MSGAISYNNNSLQTASIITSDIKHHSAPKRIINKGVVANRSKSRYISADSPEKMITISGKFVAASIAAADALEDTFKGYFVGIDKNLDIEHNGSTRRYYATPSSVLIDRPGGLMYGDYDITFDCSLPFGIDTTSTTLATVTAHTAATLTTPVSIGGSAEYQYPVTTVTLVSGTQLSGQTISIGNSGNGQVINITRNWVAGDVLVIDPFNDLYTVNGVEVAFTGAPPIFKTGTGGVTYADTFLTRSVNISIIQYKLWA